jgi:hypothetical protein
MSIDLIRCLKESIILKSFQLNRCKTSNVKDDGTIIHHPTLHILYIIPTNLFPVRFV